MKIIEEFKRSDIDTKIGVAAWVLFFGVVLVLPIIVVISTSMKQLSIDEEKTRCEDYVISMALKNGQEGFCELYFDENRNLHYFYVEVFGRGEYRRVDMDWKTMRPKK